MPLDVDRLAEVMLEGVQALISKATAPLMATNNELRTLNESLVARVMVLEGRAVPALATESVLTDSEIRALRDDWSAVSEKADAAISLAEALNARPTPEAPDVAPMVDEAVKAAVAALPQPRDGKDADPAEIEAIRASIEDVRKAIPVIPDAPDLSGFVTRDALAQAVEDIARSIPEPVEPKDWTPEIEAVRSAIPAPVDIPPPPDLSGFATKDDIAEVAASIPQVKDWTPEIAGLAARVEAIRMPEVIHGKDGVSLVGAKQNDDGELILKATNGETFNVGKVRGADGLGFDDMKFEDGEREFSLIFTKGDRSERVTAAKAGLYYQGVWKDGAFLKGDAVTLAGSVFIAQRDTEDKPGQSDAWRLAVKAGRNGKDTVSLPPKQGPVKI